jgi:hypothetical protein
MPISTTFTRGLFALPLLATLATPALATNATGQFTVSHRQ